MVVTQRRSHLHKHLDATSTGDVQAWEIRDKILPKVPVGNHDDFEIWPDGDCRRVYDSTASADAARHWTGWAMRNTNNHNQTVLKKSCIGLLVCSNRHTTGCSVRLRPAICSKARQKQLGSECPGEGCDGTLTIHGCSGNRGYPVTHSWRIDGDTIYFEAKGSHDHPPPDQRWTKDGLIQTIPATRLTQMKCRKRTAASPSTLSTSSLKLEPETVTFNFWSPDRKDGRAECYVGDVTVPDISRNDGDAMTSSSSITYPGASPPHESSHADWWSTPFVTYPSPDPVPVSESTSGYRMPYCIYSGWMPEPSPHDQWLEASSSSFDEDCRPQQVYNGTDKLYDLPFFCRQQYSDSFHCQSLCGAVRHSLEGVNGSLPYDNDYIDDVLSVMKEAANNSVSMCGIAYW